MMSGEIVYSDITFTQHQNQDGGAESKDYKGAAKREEDVTYSEVRRPGGRAREQADPQKGSDPGTSDPSPSVRSNAAIPQGGPASIPVGTLVCLCVLLLGLAITLGVLYASNMTSLQAGEALFAQMKENLTGKLHELQDNYKRLQNETNNITVQRELLSLELQDCKANLTRVKDLLATIQGNQKRCNTSQLCSPGWEFYNGSCYYFSTDKLTWEQSQYACIRGGGHLVIIESQQEQAFITDKLVRGTDFDNSPWIGLTDEKQEGVWVWMDNTTLDDRIKFWDPNTGTSNPPEPNDWNPGEDCARMGQSCSSQIECWFDYACDQPFQRELLFSYLGDCEANLTRAKDLLATIQGNQKKCNADPKQCSPGWEFYNGSCYYFSKDKLTWEQSQYACIRDGGHLVIIESSHEQEFLKQRVVTLEIDSYDHSPWIGLTDAKQENVWVWMDNTTLNENLKYWDDNDPNNRGPNNNTENCVRIGQHCLRDKNCWFDFPCAEPSKRICESRSAIP